MARGGRRKKRREPETDAAPKAEGRFAEPLLNERPVATLDLHGLRAVEAEQRVVNFIQTEAQRRPGAVVSIIVGKGLRSPGQPVLPGVVEGVLRTRLQTLVTDVVRDPFGGGFRVRVKG